MPLYEFECDECKKITERVFTIARKPNWVGCSCGGFARSIISRVNVICDWAPYVDENMSSEPILVQSRKHHSELLKRFDLEVKDPINRRRFKEKVEDLKNSRDAREALRKETGSNRRKTPDFSGRASKLKDSEGTYLVRES